MENSKYIAFKREEWGLRENGTEPKPIEDFTIIRHQDIFAAPALYSYANTIMTVIEIQQRSGSPVDPRLTEIADYFMSAGDAADNFATKKLPD